MVKNKEKYFKEESKEVKIWKKNQYIVRHGNDWAVRGAGNSIVTKVTDMQKEDYELARKIGINQQSEVSIQSEDGKLIDATAIEMIIARQKIKIII